MDLRIPSPELIDLGVRDDLPAFDLRTLELHAQYIHVLMEHEDVLRLHYRKVK
jgi:hypothetical protein